MVRLQISFELRGGIQSLQSYRSCRRSLGVVYLDLELPERLEQAYWDSLGSNAICQLGRAIERLAAHPWCLTDLTDISFWYRSLVYSSAREHAGISRDSPDLVFFVIDSSNTSSSSSATLFFPFVVSC